MQNNNVFANLIKNRKVELIAAAVFVLALASVLIFAGYGASSEPITEDVSSAEQSAVPESASADGYGLFINGQFIAACSEESALADAVFAYGESYVAANAPDDGAEYSFLGFSDEVEVKNGVYPGESFVKASELGSLLAGGVSDYCGKDLGFELTVRFSGEYSVTNVIEYSTENVYTDALKAGQSKTVVAGVDGESVDTYRVTFVDGVKSEPELVSSDIILESVDEVVEIGTSSSDTRSVASLGILQKPYDGILSSTYGLRWGRLHAGIDIVKYHGSCKDDPAYAAADGTVSFAGVYGGYGNCVIIDHGDGLQTLYAHFTSISVSEGQEVKAGEEVGKIGMTGRATGYHLHFEVRVDGETVDPLLFVEYTE